jgi:hypothetical protein
MLSVNNLKLCIVRNTRAVTFSDLVSEANFMLVSHMCVKTYSRTLFSYFIVTCKILIRKPELLWRIPLTRWYLFPVIFRHRILLLCLYLPQTSGHVTSKYLVIDMCCSMPQLKVRKTCDVPCLNYIIFSLQQTRANYIKSPLLWINPQQVAVSLPKHFTFK